MIAAWVKEEEELHEKLEAIEEYHSVLSKLINMMEAERMTMLRGVFMNVLRKHRAIIDRERRLIMAAVLIQRAQRRRHGTSCAQQTHLEASIVLCQPPITSMW